MLITPGGQSIPVKEEPSKPITKQDTLPLSKTVVRLLNTHPFYGWILANMSRQFTNTLDTYAAVGVADRLVLYIEPHLFNKLSTKEQEGMLEHEINHILLDHIKRHPKSVSNDPKRRNLAEDIVINDLVDPEWKFGKLPRSGVNSSMFGFPAGKTSEWYYTALESKMQKITIKLPDQNRELNGNSSSGGSDGSIEITVLDSHDKWGGNETNDKAGISEVMISAAIARLIDQAERETQSYETLPGWLQQRIDQIRAPKMVPWQKILRRFIAKGGKGRLIYTKKRESKRYHTRPGTRLGNQLKVWVAIDDSGSISDYQLAIFASELRHIKNTGAEVWVIEADTEVTRVHQFKKRLISVTGRGGTDLSAPFRWLIKKKIRPDVFVYMTDGYGPTLATMPFPTLWVFTQNGTPPVDWGQQITIKDKDLQQSM